MINSEEIVKQFIYIMLLVVIPVVFKYDEVVWKVGVIFIAGALNVLMVNCSDVNKLYRSL